MGGGFVVYAAGAEMGDEVEEVVGLGDFVVHDPKVSDKIFTELQHSVDLFSTFDA